jgi:hypothetical protein
VLSKPPDKLLFCSCPARRCTTNFGHYSVGVTSASLGALDAYAHVVRAGGGSGSYARLDCEEGLCDLPEYASAASGGDPHAEDGLSLLEDRPPPWVTPRLRSIGPADVAAAFHLNASASRAHAQLWSDRCRAYGSGLVRQQNWRGRPRQTSSVVGVVPPWKLRLPWDCA